MPKSTMSNLVMLRKTDEFSSVFSFRRRFSSAFLVVHYAFDNSPDVLTQTRVGFVVAKKVAKLAVDRNYMRRVLRAICRQELHLLTHVGLRHVSVVIQVQKPFKNSDFLTIKQELANLFVKIQNKLMVE
jgi:ribonuclease P protein component